MISGLILIIIGYGLIKLAVYISNSVKDTPQETKKALPIAASFIGGVVFFGAGVLRVIAWLW